MNDNRFGLSVAGTITAAVTGMFLGAGYVLLHNDKASMEIVRRRTMGGALLITGLYLWAPAWMRRGWLD